MKIAFITFAILTILALTGLFILARQSQTAPTLGLEGGLFKPCEYATNCVNSMKSGDTAIAPFPIKGDAEEAWTRIKSAVIEMGGEIQTESDGYLWATFKSKWFGFVDDLELSLDRDNNVIHVRSSSRVGRSDFGMNRKRVEQIRALYLK